MSDLVEHVGLFLQAVLQGLGKSHPRELEDVFFTRALVFPSLFGVIAIISQWMSGGVNDNPLTVPYSIFFSAWSIIFLGTWKRRENELAFLWGSKECELTCMSYHFLRTVRG